MAKSFVSKRWYHGRRPFVLLAMAALAGCIAPPPEQGAEIEKITEALAATNASGENLAGANLGGANLAGANLGGANLGGSNLGGNNLGGTNLGGTNLGGNNLGGSNLAGSNLAGTNLAGSTWRVQPRRINLAGTNLAGSNLAGSNLAGNNLAGTNLAGSNLAGTNTGSQRPQPDRQRRTGCSTAARTSGARRPRAAWSWGSARPLSPSCSASSRPTPRMYVALGKLPWGFATVTGGPVDSQGLGGRSCGATRPTARSCWRSRPRPPGPAWPVSSRPSSAGRRPPARRCRSAASRPARPTTRASTPPSTTYTGMMNAAAQWKAGKVNDKNFMAGEVAFVSATTNNQSVMVDFASWVMDKTSNALILGNVESVQSAHPRRIGLLRGRQRRRHGHRSSSTMRPSPPRSMPRA